MTANARAIDIHNHIVPADIPPYAGKHGGSRWPQMAACDANHKNVMIDGKNFRTVSDQCWAVTRRIEAMDATGIGVQVLSPMPELLSYWFPPDDAVAFGHVVNGAIAEMVARAPTRFAGLGMVPLQDPELAARELERLMKDGFRGVEIGTNVNGVAIGDPRFESFFAAAERLGAAIFVHALHPASLERIVGPPRLVPFVAFPGETNFAICSLITGGTLERHPKLRIAFSHGGGTFAIVLPRLAQGWSISPALREIIKINPRETARRLYYDTLVFEAKTIRLLIDLFGTSQLCIGSDFPFDGGDKEPLREIGKLGLSADDLASLHEGNAKRFLGLA
ncbi:MAG TPA: amidohydrolase family protein [Stellaceae bacterium]|nr:amidohydrolase family protein [Stellaceae bacterium]